MILKDIVALFLCKPSAIGSKTAKLLATLDFEMLPEFWCCITCFQVYVEFFLKLENFFGIFFEIPLNSAIVLLKKSPYFGIINLDLDTLSKTSTSAVVYTFMTLSFKNFLAFQWLFLKMDVKFKLFDPNYM